MELELHQLDRRYEGLRRRSPQREQRLLSSLAAHGQQMPIVVVAATGDERWPVIDGYKRLRALVQLRRDVIQATRWTLPEPDALILEWRMRAATASDALEQAWLLQELRDRFEVTEAELAVRFDRSKSWVSRRLALLSELPDEIQQAVREDKLGAHAAMRSLVPLARANRDECLTLVKALGGRKPTSRQVAALHAALLSARDEARALILRDPWLFLRAQAEAQQETPGPRTPAQKFLSELGALCGLQRKLQGRLRQGVTGLMPSTEQEEARQRAALARLQGTQLFHRLTQELGDAQ